MNFKFVNVIIVINLLFDRTKAEILENVMKNTLCR